MPQLAAAHAKVPRVRASLRPGFPACPEAQSSLHFPMLMHDKDISKPSRPQHRAAPFSEAAVSYGRGHE